MKKLLVFLALLLVPSILNAASAVPYVVNKGGMSTNQTTVNPTNVGVLTLTGTGAVSIANSTAIRLATPLTYATNIADRANVLSWGATGVGPSHDDAPGIQAAINAAGPSGVVTLPEGKKFYLGSTLYPLNGTTLKSEHGSSAFNYEAGVGHTATNVILIWTNPAVQVAIDAATNWNVTISGLVMDGNGNNTANGVSDGVRFGIACTILDCYIAGFTNTAVQLTNAANSCAILRSSLSYNTNGVGLEVMDSTPFQLKDSNLRANLHGMRIASGANAAVQDCVIESNTRFGVVLYGKSPPPVSQLYPNNIKFQSIHLEGNHWGALWSYNDIGASGPPTHCTFEDSIFYYDGIPADIATNAGIKLDASTYFSFVRPNLVRACNITQGNSSSGTAWVDQFGWPKWTLFSGAYARCETYTRETWGSESGPVISGVGNLQLQFLARQTNSFTNYWTWGMGGPSHYSEYFLLENPSRGVIWADQAGNVGVGHVPGSMFDVAGSMAGQTLSLISSNGSQLTYTGSTNAGDMQWSWGLGAYNYYSNYMILTTNNVARWIADSDGRLALCGYFGPFVPTATLDVGGEVRARYGVLTESLIATNNSYFLNSVGIGTNNPQTSLHVNGTVLATAFAGDGSGLTNLPSAGSSNITDSGYVAVARNLTVNTNLIVTNNGVSTVIRSNKVYTSTVDAYTINEQLNLNGKTYLTFAIDGAQKAFFSSTALRLYEGLIWDDDGTKDIGLADANRPRNIYAKTAIVSAGTITATNGFVLTTNAVNTGVLPLGKVTFTNLTSDITIAGFSGVDFSVSQDGTLVATNGTATDYRITWPAGVSITPTNTAMVAGLVTWVSNRCKVRFPFVVDFGDTNVGVVGPFNHGN